VEEELAEDIYCTFICVLLRRPYLDNCSTTCAESEFLRCRGAMRYTVTCETSTLGSVCCHDEMNIWLFHPCLMAVVVHRLHDSPLFDNNATFGPHITSDRFLPNPPPTEMAKYQLRPSQIAPLTTYLLHQRNVDQWQFRILPTSQITSQQMTLRGPP
jgi:hypothetical protein